jgi:hypothetical protein
MVDKRYAREYALSMKSPIQKEAIAAVGYSVKEKRTFSLSRDVVEYLEKGCAETHAPSLSAYLESVVREFQAKVEMEKREAATMAYYDGLTADEIDEQAEWGRAGAASIVEVGR